MLVSRDRMVLSAAEAGSAGTLEVRFGDQQVWTVPTPPVRNGTVTLTWPRPLADRLRGRTRVRVRDAATGTELAAADAAFGGTGAPDLTDRQGRPLVVDARGHLVLAQERDEGARGRLLAETAAIAERLRAAGHEPYLVGAALHGIERTGTLPEGEEDLDLAYLSAHAHPAELALESWAIERALAAEGRVVTRHSLAHLQVERLGADGRPDLCVDVFTGYQRDGAHHQPYALRGTGLSAGDLAPTGSRTVDGVDLPVPARPEAWLTFGYGAGWREHGTAPALSPDPSTAARFETWFGSYNAGRDTWESAYLGRAAAGGDGDGSDVAAFLAEVPAGARILDLGCGDGTWTRALAEGGHDVLGVDWSREALRMAGALPPPATGSVDLRYLNFFDRAAVLELGAQILGTGQTWCVLAHLTLASMSQASRANVFLLLAMVLRGEGIAVSVHDTETARNFSHTDPATWHLPTDWLQDEAGRHGLVVTVTGTGHRPSPAGPRPTATVRLERATDRTR